MPGNLFFRAILIALPTLFSGCASAPRSPASHPVVPFIAADAPPPESAEGRRLRVLEHMLKLAEKSRYTALDVASVLQAGPFSEEEGVDSLLAALDDPREDVREDARALLWRLPSEFLPHLLRRCPRPHRALAAQIAASRGAAALDLVPQMISWYEEAAEDADTRLAVFNAAGSLAPGRPEVAGLMRRGLWDPDERIRLFAVSFLVDDPDAAVAVQSVLAILRQSQDPAVADCADFWLKYRRIRQTALRGETR